MAANPKKKAFEQVRSGVERRHLFEEAFKEKSTFLCKLEDEDLIQFAPVSLKDGVLSCLAEHAPKTQGPQGGIGNFSVGDDRYFFNGEVSVKGSTVSFSVEIDVFKLERRKTMRVPVPEGFDLSLNIIDINGKPTLRAAQIADVSAGGVRFYFPQNPTGEWIPPNSKIKGVLHLPSQKILDFDGEVRHIQKISLDGVETAHFGTEFGACRDANMQRMITLTFEIQKKLAKDS